MAMPEKFTLPWVDVDPSLRHGGIADELAVGWVGPDLNDNTETQNRDAAYLVYMMGQFATSISMHPEAEAEGFPGKRLVSEALSAMDTFTERLVDVTHTHATKFFSFTHAVPPISQFRFTPIRYPVRNQFADDFLHYAIGTMVEIAENNRNALHQGFDPNASNILLEAMWNWKATVMKFWFDKEVAGEISSRELANLYSGVLRPQPSYPDETADTPSDADTTEALQGLDVLSWVPSDSDWTKFAELHQRRYTPERAFQPEGARPTTEDVAHESATNADGTISTDGPSV
jgi:hypothetical protein